MNRERKLCLFHELVRIGFKEIEVGFPSASRTDFDIVRDLIDDNQIPADVTPMVITQLREDLIEETVRSVAGARSEEHTSELQSLMRISYAVFCLKQKKTIPKNQ